MTPHNRLRGEFKEQCFCTDVSLKYATLACKYSKDEVADWWLSKFDQELESIIGEIQKKKYIEAVFPSPNSGQRLREKQLRNQALDIAIKIIRDKITK